MMLSELVYHADKFLISADSHGVLDHVWSQVEFLTFVLVYYFQSVLHVGLFRSQIFVK